MHNTRHRHVKQLHAETRADVRQRHVRQGHAYVCQRHVRHLHRHAQRVRANASRACSIMSVTLQTQHHVSQFTDAASCQPLHRCSMPEPTSAFSPRPCRHALAQHT
eukprot:372919-Rhodomonas_salina.1